MKLNAGSASTIARFTDGSPAAIQIGDRVLVFAFPADDSWTDFPLAAQFLPFVHEVNLFLSSSMGFGENYTIGEEVVVTGKVLPSQKLVPIIEKHLGG